VFVRGAQGGQVHGFLASGAELELALEIPSGVDVEGLVTDAQGRPIGGARVWVSDFAMFNLGHLAATTDDKGAFRLRSVGPQRWITAKAKGFALSYLHEVRGHAGDVARLTIELDREGAQLSGRVLDRSGAPLAGALVLVGTEEVLPTRILASGLGTPDTPPQLLRADDQGRFEVDGVPLGSCAVQARARGHCAGRAETIVGPQGGQIEILLDAGATLSGLASTLGGRTLASVEISHGRPGKFCASFVYSDSRGRYELEGLPPGDVLVSAMAIEHGKLEETLHLAPGERREWNPRFPDAANASARIRGVVLDDHDAPLVGWNVLAQIARDPGAACIVSPPTDKLGAFVLAAQEQETYRVLVQAPEEWTQFPRAVRDGVRAGGEPLTIRIGDDARTNGRITGSVVDALGAPVSDAQVVVWHNGLGTCRTAAVGGPQAHFELLHVPPGELEIDVRSETHPWSKVGQRTLRAGELLDLGALRLADSGFVRGALRGVGDEALTSIELLVSSKEGRWIGTATIADHEFRSSALAPGDYTLLVKGAAIVDQSRAFQIAVGRETRLDLDLTPAAARRVVCTLPEPSARPEWITFLVVDSSGQSACMRNVRSGEGPTASADLALAPGSYTLRVLTRAGQGPSLAFTQSGSGHEEELRVTLAAADAPR
jgi:protocatechuate 3,4-dioxygenase beta subunit